MDFLKFILFGFIVFIYLHESLSCAGYELKITNFKKCIKNQLFDLSANTTLIINDNCELILDSCIKVKSFKTAVNKVSVTKNGIQMTQNVIDTCKTLAKNDKNVKVAGKFFGIPNRCPVNGYELCDGVPRSLDFTRFSKFFPLAIGILVFKIEVDFDSGKSCYQVDIETKKK